LVGLAAYNGRRRSLRPEFAAGTSVALVATPKVGYTFVEWTGACSGTAACVVYMDDLANVNAFFVPITGGAITPASAIPTLAEWALVVVSLLVFLAAGPSLRRLPSRVQPGR
jgi:hypothetical protein